MTYNRYLTHTRTRTRTHTYPPTHLHDGLQCIHRHQHDAEGTSRERGSDSFEGRGEVNILYMYACTCVSAYGIWAIINSLSKMGQKRSSPEVIQWLHYGVHQQNRVWL